MIMIDAFATQLPTVKRLSSGSEGGEGTHLQEKEKSAFFMPNNPYFPFPITKQVSISAGKTRLVLPSLRRRISSSKETLPCLHCQSELTIRHGKRKIKRTIVQIYKCSSCGKFFSDRKLKRKSYDAKTIFRAISQYNLGYTLEQAAKEMAWRYHQKIPLSTLRSWIKEFSGTCTFSRLRPNAVKLCNTQDMIFVHSLQHNQIYKYQLHKAKLALLSSELPAQKFPLLKAYLEKIPTHTFPHHIFQPKPQSRLEELTRSSDMKFPALDFTKMERQSAASALASLGLLLAKTNRERHEAVQSFMLANDSVTIAAEVPVYLTGDDIAYFRNKGFTLNFENYRTPITGHIDILQISNGLIHILDYKPEARKVNAVNQLTIYALALASRAKLAVKDFKCAWFDDKNYYEFFPLHAVYNRNTKVENKENASLVIQK